MKLQNIILCALLLGSSICLASVGESALTNESTVNNVITSGTKKPSTNLGNNLFVQIKNGIEKVTKSGKTDKGTENTADKNKIQTKVTTEIVSEEDILNNKVNAIFNSMTDEEKIGQLMFVGLSGTDLNHNDNIFLNEKHFGGVILYDRNMENMEQVKGLTAEIQRRGALVKNVAGNDVKLPMFMAIDAEGGLVLRMKEAWPFDVPSQQDIGAMDNPSIAKDWAKKIGSTIKYMGFNVNFAPVADVDSTYKRSYSTDFNVVKACVNQAVEGYAEENVICTLKHFPGIGRAAVDPHEDASSISETLETLKQSDLVPFADVVQNKDNNKFMVMASHLSFPAIDAEYPASISKKIITDVLKNEVGFKGLVVTDDLEMGAVSKHFAFNEMGVKAINSGADLALVCHEPERIMAVYNGLLDGYHDGSVDKERVNDAVKKIIKVKLTCLPK